LKPSASSHTSTNTIDPADLRQESIFVGLLAALASFLAFAYCFPRGMLLLYGDAVAHLGIARRLTDSLTPGVSQLGSVWLPLPHILMAPFAVNLHWWQTGIAGAIPSMIFYLASVIGLYRLARVWLSPIMACVAVAFYGLNPGLLYMQTTAMTEPLYLAEVIWGILLLVEIGRALHEGNFPAAARRIIAAAIVLDAAVLTRYDGWVFACLGWFIVAFFLWQYRAAFKSRAGGAFLFFTAALLTAPISWFLWNATQFGDWLYFARGPYSAKAIAARTTPPGASPYPGWHSPWVSLLYYLKASELGMVNMPLADILLIVGILGTIAALWLWRGKLLLPLALLWMPVPFYAFSVAYGSVPIFLPVWPPHSYYNTRYGMEMLPTFALFTAFFFDAILRWTRKRRPALAPIVTALALSLVLLDCAAQIHSGPLVFEEARANSQTRIPFEKAYARVLDSLPPYGQILAYTSAHIGAFQMAGIPLRRTINEGNYYQWKAALKHPALAAPFIVATDGDPIYKAIQQHSGGLISLDVICSTGQPCAHFYRSKRVGLDGSITPKQP
jgi:hypothetical protein